MRIIDLIVTLALLASPETVSTSGYSCQPHPANRMSNCATMRSGVGVNTKSIACSYEQMGQIWWIEGVGIRICLDTGRLPPRHFDIYRDTFTEAQADGWQERRAWRIR